MVELNYLD
jgi:hypothetical protein